VTGAAAPPATDSGAAIPAAADGATHGTPAGPLRAFVDELVLAGVRDAVICPGSRSTPLVLALRMHPGTRTWLAIDERAGAFFALGIAKASRRAAAILGTSGTAAVNFAPAVVEAHEGRVPLLLLTADRPPELRDRAAPQTIDQDHLYGRYAKWYAELPVPEDSRVMEAHLRGVVGRAVSTTLDAPAGPVHLNLPFREPLVPEGSLLPADETFEADASAPALERGGRSYARVVSGVRTLPPPELASLARSVGTARRGLIVCGPLDVPGFAGAVTRLAAATGFPILADALANVRLGPDDRSHVVGRFDVLLRSGPFRAAHVPDLVLRFGGTPTSKALVQALQADGAPQVAVDDGGWTEPTLLPVTMVRAEPAALASALADGIPAAGTRAHGPDGAWLESWLRADRVADSTIRDRLAALDEPFEGAVFAELEGRLPDGTLLLAGNSMPVRDMDAYLSGGSAAVRTLGNRGANGIDGVMSTALGAAAVHDGPVLLVVGDLSFLHDLNALVAARLHGSSLTVVLVNNDGGGIFSFLPQATTDRSDVGLPQHFEELFGTPHGIEIGRVVTALGAEHRRLECGTIGSEVAASLGRPGVRVLELRTERARNVELHRAIAAAAAAAVERDLEARLP
jgi:2-succinyl-5-enolpyruvyl-6-hydroxy-3-cyclohexene-1-carboxylate synthase